MISRGAPVEVFFGSQIRFGSTVSKFTGMMMMQPGISSAKVLTRFVQTLFGIECAGATVTRQLNRGAKRILACRVHLHVELLDMNRRCHPPTMAGCLGRAGLNAFLTAVMGRGSASLS